MNARASRSSGRAATSTTRRVQPVEGLPAITVVIPCYNYGHFLQDAARAALDQPDVDVRVVIVDDASPDGSGDVAERLAAEDPRISVIRHAQNRGHIQTYTDGFAKVTTEFVTLVSADDLVAPGALGRAIALMQQHPSIGLVYGPVEIFEVDPAQRSRRRQPYWRVWNGRDWGRTVMHQAANPIRSPEAVLRTEALREVGDYSADLPHAADLEYWLRVALAWDIGFTGNVTQAYYRVHGANMHLTTFHDVTLEREQLYAALQPFLRGDTASADRVRVQRAVVDPVLRIVERLLAIGRWSSESQDLITVADRIWPEWRESRLWSPLSVSLKRRNANRMPTIAVFVRSWLPGQADRVCNRAAGALRARRRQMDSA